MADLFDLGDGLIVDSDGVIVECASGAPDLTRVAVLAAEAQQQIKTWEAYAGALKAVLVAQQEDRKATYGDVLVSINQTTYRDIDSERLADLLFKREADVDTLLAAIQLGKFNEAAAAEIVGKDDAARCVVLRQSKAFAKVERVRKAAPVPVGVA